MAGLTSWDQITLYHFIIAYILFCYSEYVMLRTFYIVYQGSFLINLKPLITLLLPYNKWLVFYTIFANSHKAIKPLMWIQDIFIEYDNDWRNKLQRRDRLYYFSSFLFMPYTHTDAVLGAVVQEICYIYMKIETTTLILKLS